jgi:flavin-dependent dehydrogenase
VVLDAVLVDAAVESGAELREGAVVDGLITNDDGRVSGIRGRTASGIRFQENGAIVVGADGMRSVVARLVEAPEYHTRPPLQGTYFTYWDGVTIDGVSIYPRDWRAVYGWMTNNEQALIGVNWNARDYPAVRGDIEGHYRAVIEAAAPDLAEQLHGATRAGKWVGGAIRNFFRRPYGPGWALVGDAGYQKDPSTAQGISDAFRDAELLAEAIDDALAGRRPVAEALADYEQQRNEAALPLYEFTCQLAPFEPATPEMHELIDRLHGEKTETERFFGVFAGTVAVDDFFSKTG